MASYRSQKPREIHFAPGGVALRHWMGIDGAGKIHASASDAVTNPDAPAVVD